MLANLLAVFLSLIGPPLTPPLYSITTPILTAKHANALLPARHVPAAMVSASADLASLWHSSARELEATGKMIEAIAHMQQAVKCTSVDVFEHQQRRLWLGMLYEDIGYIEEAIAVYEGLATNHSRWKMYVANVLLDGRGEKHRALQLFRGRGGECRGFSGCELRPSHRGAPISVGRPPGGRCVSRASACRRD